MRHIDVTRYLHLFTIFNTQFSVTPLFLNRTRRPTHNSLKALTVRRCHRHGLRHNDFDLWILSRGMVWSHADHREGIHWCPAHQCHLCGKRRYVSQPSKVDAGWHHPGHLHDMYLIVMTSSWKASVSGALALTLPFSCLGTSP